MVFVREEKAQAEAADVFAIALLMSFSYLLITIYGLGAYNEHLPMAALQHRYTEDFCQSFILTSDYISSEINYTVGPHGTFSKFSDIIKRATGTSPLNRNVKATILDLIGQDLYLSLAFHYKNQSLPLNNRLLTERFHGAIESLIKEEFRFFSGNNFDYRIEASYHPFKGTGKDRFLFSEVVYSSGNFSIDAEKHITSFYIPVAAYDKKLNLSRIESLSDSLDGSLFSILPFKADESKSYIHFFQLTSDTNPDSKDLENTPVSNEYAEVRMIVWPKENG